MRAWRRIVGTLLPVHRSASEARFPRDHSGVLFHGKHFLVYHETPLNTMVSHYVSSESAAWFKKGAGTVVRSTLRAVPVTVSDPFFGRSGSHRTGVTHLLLTSAFFNGQPWRLFGASGGGSWAVVGQAGCSGQQGGILPCSGRLAGYRWDFAATVPMFFQLPIVSHLRLWFKPSNWPPARIVGMFSPDSARCFG